MSVVFSVLGEHVVCPEQKPKRCAWGEVKEATRRLCGTFSKAAFAGGYEAT